MSLQAVAEEAGVSVATASRAVRQPHLVSAEKLRAVQEAVATLGYHPVRRRVTRSGEKSFRVGVWVIGAAKRLAATELKEQMFELQLQLGTRDAEMHVGFSEDTDSLPERLAEQSLDGLMLQGYAPAPQAFSTLPPVPLVWLMTRREMELPFDSVEPDNEANGRQAAGWLAQKGAKRVAVINAWPGHPAFSIRQLFFEHEAQARGLQVESLVSRDWDHATFLHKAPSEAMAQKLGQKFLSLRGQVDGIFFPDDYIYGWFCRLLRQENPELLAKLHMVVGDYHRQLVPHFNPVPACLDIGVSDIVETAVDRLFQRMQNPVTGQNPVRHLVMPTLREPQN